MNLKEKIVYILSSNVESDNDLGIATLDYQSVEVTAGKIEELVKELAVEFATTHSVRFSSKECAREVFDIFIAEKV